MTGLYFSLLPLIFPKFGINANINPYAVEIFYFDPEDKSSRIAMTYPSVNACETGDNYCNNLPCNSFDQDWGA